MLTEQEYLDPKRFPLSTQAGLNLEDQHFLDAHRFDEFKAMEEDGRPLSERGAAMFAELKNKLPNAPGVGPG